MIWFVISAVVVMIGFLVYASACIHSGVYVKTQCQLQTKAHEIALTFDDGIDAIQTPKVLDVLAKYNVKATFFVIGEKIENHHDILRRIIAEGHQVGLHAYHHSTKFCFASTHKVVDDLTHLQELIYSITGQTTHLFRPPIGITNPNIGKAVKQMKLNTIGWNIRSLDTIKRKSRNDILRRIEHRLQPGSIILLHDDRTRSEYLTEQLIISLQLKGYKIVKLS